MEAAPHLTCIDACRRITAHCPRLLAKWHSSYCGATGDLLPDKARSQICMPLIWLRLLKDVGDFDISVAAYPEVHPEAKKRTG